MALDPQALSELKEKLLSEKNKLEGEISRMTTPSSDGVPLPKHDEIGDTQDENATESEEFGDNLALEQNLLAQLADVKSALSKMETGKYGICEKTGREIPLDRLKAYPAARTVVEA